MKRLLSIIFCILLLAACAEAATVELAWNASVSDNVAGYAVFSRDYTHAYDTALWQGSEPTCTVDVPGDRQTAFVARAFAYGPYDLEGNRTVLWSGNSNEVIYTPTVSPPQPPRNIVVRILVAIAHFLGRLFV
jgi:opacity protein-like surface antigen